MTRHVLIASVPEREDNLRALIADIQTQTVQPDAIVVYLNGYTVPIQFPKVECRWSPVRRPAGSRWEYVDEVSPETILCVIDDDFRLHPTYLERTTCHFDSSIGMIAWTGHTRLSEYHFFQPSDTALSLIIGGVGASAIRAEAIRGITEHRLSTELLSNGGDDELLVSILLQERNQRIVRPAGTLPFQSVDTLQYAESASHKQHAKQWQHRRQELAQEYGWTR